MRTFTWALSESLVRESQGGASMAVSYHPKCQVNIEDVYACLWAEELTEKWFLLEQCQEH